MSPIPALISLLASNSFAFLAGVIPAMSSMLSSSSSSSLATRSKSPSVSPKRFALRTCRRSSRSLAFRRFSCRFCLSVLGIIARMSSASRPALAFFSFFGCFSRCAGPFFFGFSLVAFFPFARAVSASISSSLSFISSTTSSSFALFFLDSEVAEFTTSPMLANRGLLNQRAVFTEDGSSANLWINGLLSSPVFCFFRACSDGVTGASWKPSSSSLLSPSLSLSSFPASISA
mmetsp:Transcript_10832/g.26195  ORF Transcript_10832/g.26195 Transcript_10832/m.26195 type:complete len:232 (+) Transcript_10832:735-1430(+)